MNYEIHIGENGDIQHVYDDALAGMFDGVGAVTVRRASHVEPTTGGWSADLGPVGGPVLGPFPLRAEALAAERQWLDERMAEGLLP